MMPNKNTGREILFVILLASLIFSLEYPLPGTGSEYSSINTEDAAIALITVVFIYDLATSHINITIRDKYLWLSIVAASVWILITLLVAAIRGENILISILWTLKWFEAMVLLFVSQQYLEHSNKSVIFKSTTILGILLAGFATAAVIMGHYRFRLFFGNPNILSSFFVLVSLLSFSYVLKYDRLLARIIYSLGGIVAIYGILATGSRSGVLGLIVGISMFAILLRKKIININVYYIIGAFLLAIISIPFVITEILIRRLTGWFKFENGSFMLTDSLGSDSIRIRIRLIKKGINLFWETPIFGRGWYASPSRVGVLDMHYTTLLVEIGIIGFILIALFYLCVIRSFMIARNTDMLFIGSALTAWFISLLVQSIGGNFPRAPQLMFIYLLMVAAARAAPKYKYN